MRYRKIYHIIQRNDEIEPEIKALSKRTILEYMRRQKILLIVQKRPKNGKSIIYPKLVQLFGAVHSTEFPTTH